MLHEVAERAPAWLAAASLTAVGRKTIRRAYGLVDVQLVQEGDWVVERLEQVLVVLDHLAAHVDAEPLLVDVQLIAIEHFPHRQIPLREEPSEEHRALEAERDGLEV